MQKLSLRVVGVSIIVTMMLLGIGVPLIAGAQDEDNTLHVLCSPHEDWCNAMAEAFETETGIETIVDRVSSGDALALIRETTDAPEYSVWWGGPVDGFIAGTNEGLFEAYQPPNADWIAVNMVDKDHYWHGVYIGVLGFCSNVELLEELGVEPPTSWDDLLAPELAGNVAMAHPMTSGTAYTALWTVVTLKADELEAEEAGTGYAENGDPTAAAVDAALDYFVQLTDNLKLYTRSGSAPGQMAGEGEVAVSVLFSHDCTKIQVEGYADVLVTTFAAEGTGYEIGGVSLIKNAPEPETAKVWINWALSAEAQAIAPTANAFQLATNPATPFNPLSVSWDDVNLISYNFVASGRNRVDVLGRFEAEVAPPPED